MEINIKLMEQPLQNLVSTLINTVEVEYKSQAIQGTITFQATLPTLVEGMVKHLIRKSKKSVDFTQSKIEKKAFFQLVLFEFQFIIFQTTIPRLPANPAVHTHIILNYGF